MLRLALLATIASSTLAGQAKGELTVAGSTQPLGFAYAYLQPSEERRDRNELVLVMSDSMMPPAIERNHAAQDELSKAGKIHFVRLTFTYPDPGPPLVLHYAIGHKAAKDPPRGTVTYHRFQGKLGPDTVTGKASSDGPQESIDGVKYEYACEVSVKLLPK